jgi:hypothetical protein
VTERCSSPDQYLRATPATVGDIDLEDALLERPTA